VVFDGDLDPGKTGAELAKDGGEVMESDGVNGDESESAGGGLRKAGDADMDVLEDIEDVARGLVEQLSFRREGDATAKAFEQGNAESFFERTDLLRDGALRDLIEGCGSGEPAGGNEVAKDFERLDLHWSRVGFRKPIGNAEIVK